MYPVFMPRMVIDSLDRESQDEVEAKAGGDPDAGQVTRQEHCRIAHDCGPACRFTLWRMPVDMSSSTD